MERVAYQKVEPAHMPGAGAGFFQIRFGQNDRESPGPRVIMPATVRIGRDKPVQVEARAKDSADVIAFKVRLSGVTDDTCRQVVREAIDRKSTRLNSSH